MALSFSKLASLNIAKGAHSRLRRSVALTFRKLASLAKPLTLTELAKYPLLSYESSLSVESSLRKAFAATGKQPDFAFTSRDADLIKTYVRVGLGVGILAEMALLPDDAHDLHVIEASTLFPVCTTWMVLRRDRVARAFTLALAELIAPQLDRRDLQRALAGEPPRRWPEPPDWKDVVAKNKLLTRAA